MRLDLSRLNASQKEAVLHLEGPLLILAGAGSGKTSTMSYRIAHLMSHHQVAPENILGLSFTRKAAEELKTRVTGLTQKLKLPKKKSSVTITTFHSLCVRILRLHAESLGYPKNFTIIDQSDQLDTVREILKNLKLDEKKFDPQVLLFEMSHAKNRFLQGQAANEYFFSLKRVNEDYSIILANMYEKYIDLLKSRHSFDFDDLIFHTVSLLESNETARDQLNRRFKYILVDEYQDTNPAQSRILKALTQNQQNLCVVGDDDQSIYTWRGADPTHILNFSKHYPTAKVITLDQNYRSTTTILDAANSVIQQNRLRHPKTLWSDKGVGEPIEMYIVEEDRAEADTVGDEILERARQTREGIATQLRPWKDFAILFRSNSQSRLFEESLRMRKIPYQLIGAMSFLDRKEVKDLLAYWRLILNPRDDVSARRVINWPPRGIGKSSVEAVQKHALENQMSIVDSLLGCPEVAPRALEGTQNFARVLNEMKEKLEQTPPTSQALSLWAKWTLDRLEIKQTLLNDCDEPADAEKKWDNLLELAHALGQYSISELLGFEPAEEDLKSTKNITPIALREYLARLQLNATDDEKDASKENKDQVTLMTLHGAKGLEFPIVFLVGAEEGFLPHKRTLEEGTDLSEERRLCYVGITRAKEKLIITRARTRIRYGKPVVRHSSRFIEEIPKSLILERNLSLAPVLSSPEANSEHETKVKDYLASIREQISGKKAAPLQVQPKH